MKPNRNEKLEAWARHTLRQLPDKAAPAGLSALVLAEIDRREAAPWYTHPWMEWSAGAKLLSASGLTGLGYFVCGVAIPWLKTALFAAPIAKDAAATYQTASAVGDAAAALGRAGWLTVSQANPTVLIGVAAVFAVAWFSTLGLGTACWRLARSKNWN